MNVLSLFDGMSCGQIALERANINVDNYFASEIDKYTIQITQKNYPNTIQLGDINNWKKWKLPRIDLLIGGSPCQGFSIAGKGINFDDPRSKLFFEYVEILKYLKKKNPNIKFLLENVRMKKEWASVISKYLDVQPILIDSSLVSAQSRKRFYWTNWNFDIPEDRGIYLKDIIISGEPLRDKSYTIDANYYKGGTRKNHDTKSFQKLRESERRCIIKENTKFITGGAIRNQVTNRGTETQLNIRTDGKSNAVVSSYAEKLNGLIQVGHADGINGYDIVKRIYSINGKSPTLTNMQGGHRQPKIALDDIHYRKLYPLECERLQTVPDNYTEGVSNSQRYKMLGNGWTVDVIVHILSYL